MNDNLRYVFKQDVPIQFYDWFYLISDHDFAINDTLGSYYNIKEREGFCGIVSWFPIKSVSGIHSIIEGDDNILFQFKKEEELDSTKEKLVSTMRTLSKNVHHIEDASIVLTFNEEALIATL